jgi:hypothetical protein
VRPRTAAVLAAVCVLAAILSIAVGAQVTSGQSSYDLAVEDSIETPERTVTIEGEEYTLDSVGAVEPGESLRVDVTVPSEDVYDVELRNADEQVVDRRRVEQSTSVSFDTGVLQLDPGTYALAIVKDQEITAVQPVVVSGYQLSVDLPASVAPGESAVATVDVTYTALDSAPEGIEVVAFRGDEVIRVSADKTGDRQYEATLSFAEDAPTGQYNVYAVAKGDEQLSENYPVSLAIDNGITLEVTTGGDGGNDDSGDSGSGGIGGGGSGGGAGQSDPAGEDGQQTDNESTPSPSDNGTNTNTGNETPTTPDDDGTAGNDSSRNESSGEDSSGTSGTGSTSVISPTKETDEPGAASSQPFSPVLVVVAVVLLLCHVVLLARRNS